MRQVVIPAQAKQRLQALLNNVNATQALFREYASGVKDTLGLDGEYSLDTSIWEFKPIVKEGEEKPKEE